MDDAVGFESRLSKKQTSGKKRWVPEQSRAQELVWLNKKKRDRARLVDRDALRRGEPR